MNQNDENEEFLFAKGRICPVCKLEFFPWSKTDNPTQELCSKECEQKYLAMNKESSKSEKKGGKK